MSIKSLYLVVFMYASSIWCAENQILATMSQLVIAQKKTNELLEKHHTALIDILAELKKANFLREQANERFVAMEQAQKQACSRINRTNDLLNQQMAALSLHKQEEVANYQSYSPLLIPVNGLGTVQINAPAQQNIQPQPTSYSQQPYPQLNGYEIVYKPGSVPPQLYVPTQQNGTAGSNAQLVSNHCSQPQPTMYGSYALKQPYELLNGYGTSYKQ